MFDTAVRGWTELVDLVLPRPCPGCGAAEPWCARCGRELSVAPRSVQLSPDVLDAAAGLALPPVRAVSRYRGPVRAAILAGKEHGRRDLPVLLGRQLADAVQRVAARDGPPVEWIVPAPSRRSSARARGGDPVAVMARAAAGELAARGRFLGVAPCLLTAGRARDSVGLTAAGRLANLAGRVRFVPRAAPPAGAPVLLLDDVVTSGATAVVAAAVLAQHGHRLRSVLAVAAAAPWREVPR